MMWLELLSDAKIGALSEIQSLLAESEQLLRIFVAARQTARRRRSSS